MHNFYNFKAFWINACETIKCIEILLCEYEYVICNLKHGPTFIVMCEPKQDQKPSECLVYFVKSPPGTEKMQAS